MFYLYGIPEGVLCQQIETLRGVCEKDFGRNRAHDYPVHATLTRGFEIAPEQVEDYRDAIVRHFAGATKPKIGRLKHIGPKELVLLELDAPDLAVSTFSWVDELGRADIKIIDRDFHVTIAWQTPFHARIFDLAQEVIHRSMEASWRVSLCERTGEEGAWAWNTPKGLALT